MGVGQPRGFEELSTLLLPLALDGLELRFVVQGQVPGDETADTLRKTVTCFPGAAECELCPVLLGWGRCKVMQCPALPPVV